MKDVTIRFYHRDDKGKLHDDCEDFGLDQFAGIIPSVGDKILRDGVPSGLDRKVTANREILTVTDRYFNPRDNENYVALVVSTSRATAQEEDLV